MMAWGQAGGPTFPDSMSIRTITRLHDAFQGDLAWSHRPPRHVWKRTLSGWVLVAHAYNFGYLGG
jgi:hypothetical protein